MAASADHVKALIKAHAAGDEKTFYSVSLQLAARAARQGHNRFATELRELIDSAKAERVTQLAPTPVVQPRGELADLVTAGYPDIRLDEMTFSSESAKQAILHDSDQIDTASVAAALNERRTARHR